MPKRRVKVALLPTELQAYILTAKLLRLIPGSAIIHGGVQFVSGEEQTLAKSSLLTLIMGCRTYPHLSIFWRA